jgi:hypothetical protein
VRLQRAQSRWSQCSIPWLSVSFLCLSPCSLNSTQKYLDSVEIWGRNTFFRLFFSGIVSFSLSSQCIGARYLLDIESWIWNDSEKREEKLSHIIVRVFLDDLSNIIEWFGSKFVCEKTRIALAQLVVAMLKPMVKVIAFLSQCLSPPFMRSGSKRSEFCLILREKSLLYILFLEAYDFGPCLCDIVFAAEYSRLN